MILQLEPATREFSEMPVKTTHIESVYILDHSKFPNIATPWISVWRRDIHGNAVPTPYKQTTKHGNTTLRLARARRIQDALDAQSELPY